MSAVSVSNLQERRGKQALLREIVNSHHWPFAARGMTARDLLVTEEEIAKVVGQADLAGIGPVATVQAVEPEMIAAAERVFVLLSKRERATVRRLKQRYPEASVFSATYGAEGEQISLARLGEAAPDTTLVFSTEGSGRAYLAAVLSENNLGTVISTLHEAEIAWSQIQQDFDPVRCVLAKLKGRSGQLMLGVDAEVFAALRETRPLLNKLVATMTRAVGGQALYLTRRDKISQLLQRHGYDGGGTDTATMRCLLADLIALTSCEASLERLLPNLRRVRLVTREEMQEAPVDVIKMLSLFLGAKLRRNIKVPAATEGVADAAAQQEQVRSLRDGLLAYLDVAKNEFGSYATLSQRQQQ